MPALNTRRGGFTLIEVLILVALLLVVAWLAMPNFGPGSALPRAEQNEARRRMNLVKKAISLFDAYEPAPLAGRSLEPLLGRYLEHLPEDPWGRAFLFDGDLGVLASFGRDGVPGGEAEDRDLIVALREMTPEELQRGVDVLAGRQPVPPDLGPRVRSTLASIGQ